MIAPSACVAIVLAAGLSRRFGSQDKLMAPFRGRPLATHAIELARSLAVEAVLVVAQPSLAGLVRENGARLVINPHPEDGMGGSLALGARAAAALQPETCLVLLGDMPGVTAGHVEKLFAAFAPATDIVCSSLDGQRMPPALFAARHLAALSELSGDQGARALLGQASAVMADASILRDVDRPSDIGDD